MDFVQSHNAPCPYCGETIELCVDVSPGAQEYIEDCEVCCRPIVIVVVEIGDAEFAVELRHEDE